MKHAVISFAKRYWAIVYLILVTTLLYFAFRNWVYDDPFITFRFAENIAAGRGFVYNPGSYVLSTTTPLFALILAVFAKSGLDLPQVANFLSALSVSASGLIIWGISKRIVPSPLAQRLTGLFGLAFYPTFPLIVSTFSSESTFYLAFCLAAILAYLSNREAFTGALLGLAVLTRGDAAVLAVGLAFDWLLFRRKMFPKIPWKTGLTFLLVLTPWFVYSSTVFGSPLPVTLEAKQAQALIEGSVSFAEGLPRLAGSYAVVPGYWLLALFALVGAGYALKDPSGRIIFVLWPLLYAAAYHYLGVTSYFWYYAPIAPGLIVCAGMGAAAIADWPVRPRMQIASQSAVMILILLAFSTQLASLNNLAKRNDNRFMIYRAIGEWIAENSNENASIGTLEVGMIGYFAAPRPMIDFGGLIQPEVAAEFTEGYTFGQSALWATERFQPTILVLIDGHYQQLVAQYASTRCVLAQMFIGADYGYPRNLAVYVC